MVGIWSDEIWEQFLWKKKWSNQIATRQEVQEFLTKKTERRWDKSWNQKVDWQNENRKRESEMKWKWLDCKKEQVQEVLAIKLRGSSLLGQTMWFLA